MSPDYLSPPVFPYAWSNDWGEDSYGLWMALTYRGVRQIFRWIEPGHFDMGSPENEKGRYDDEKLHQVTLSTGFWLADTCVTQAFWQAVMGGNPSHFKGDDCPVEQVSWQDAKAFIYKLQQFHPDLELRLPWEAQWEYACRTGTQSAFHFGDNLSLEKANYNGTWEVFEFADGAKQQTCKVKNYACNAWGLYEMHGNVWEWCEDVWQADLGHEPVTDTWAWQDQSDTAARRVVRGGSWFFYGRNLRSAMRNYNSPDFRINDLGLRLALGH